MTVRMMEYPRPIYIQKLSFLTKALSAAHLSMFRTLKKTRARARARTRTQLFEELAPLLFTEDYVQRVWPPTPAPAFPCFDSFRAATHPFGRGSCATP